MVICGCVVWLGKDVCPYCDVEADVNELKRFHGSDACWMRKGPYGGAGGQKFDESAKGSRRKLLRITGSFGAIMDSIQLHYRVPELVHNRKKKNKFFFI